MDEKTSPASVFEEMDASLPERARKRLSLLRWVGWLDLALLITLLTASLTGQRDLVRTLGPIHGGVFVLLLSLAGIGAVDRAWSWLFPLAILLTGGPPGTLIGEWRISRQLRKAGA